MGSGFKTFTAGSVLTASDMNNYLMEQSVMYFATTTARDTAITAPERGMTCWLSDSGSLLVYYGATTGWRPPWTQPWGFIGKTELSSNSTGISTLADLTGGSLTFTALANRYYMIQSQCLFKISSSGTEVTFQIREGSTTLCASINQANSNNAHTLAVTRTLTFSAGSHTIKLSIGRQAGTGTIATDVDATNRPDFLQVIDLGPTGSAPSA